MGRREKRELIRHSTRVLPPANKAGTAGWETPPTSLAGGGCTWMATCLALFSGVLHFRRE